VGNRVPETVWIFRKGNGQLRVHPSPVVLKQDEAFTIANLAEADATVTFDAKDVRPAQDTIKSGGVGFGKTFTAIAPKGTYFEYTVTVNGQYADGGSKPGGIVDP
jgi:hypothetical protein